jgi:hypothetical protein
MILVYLSSGECIEVPEGVAVSQRDGDFVCVDGHGATLASFETDKVEAYTSNPEIAEAIMDAVCEDLTVIPPTTSSRGSASS